MKSSEKREKERERLDHILCDLQAHWRQFFLITELNTNKKVIQVKAESIIIFCLPVILFFSEKVK